MMSVTAADLGRIDEAVDRMVKSRLRGQMATFSNAMADLVKKEPELFRARARLRAGRSERETIPYGFKGGILIRTGEEMPKGAPQSIELPESVRSLIAKIDAERAVLSTIEAELASAKSETQRLASAISSNERAIRQRDRAIAEGGGALPSDPYPEEAQSETLKRHHRVLSAKQPIVQARIQAQQAKIAALVSELRCAWFAYLDARATSALEKYREAVADAEDAFLEVRLASLDLDGRALRNSRKAYVPELLRAGGIKKGNGCEVLCDTADLRWGERMAERAVSRELDLMRKAVNRAISGPRVPVSAASGGAPGAPIAADKPALPQGQPAQEPQRNAPQSRPGSSFTDIAEMSSAENPRNGKEWR